MNLQIPTKTEVFHELLVKLLLVLLGHLDDLLSVLAVLLINSLFMMLASPLVSFLETYIKLFNVSATRAYGKEEQQAKHTPDVLQSLPECDGGGHDLKLGRPKVYLYPTLLAQVIP